MGLHMLAWLECQASRNPAAEPNGWLNALTRYC